MQYIARKLISTTLDVERLPFFLLVAQEYF